MRFLVDECTGPAVAKWLLEQNHEVLSVYDKARGLDDELIIQKAFTENWILITNDKGFGEKIYRERYPHRGVILMQHAYPSYPSVLRKSMGPNGRPPTRCMWT